VPSYSGDDWLGQEHDFSCHPFLSKQLVCDSRINEWKSFRDERLDFLLFEEFEKGAQILSKQRGFPPFEPLDAVGDEPFPAWKQPASGNVQSKDGKATEAIPTT